MSPQPEKRGLLAQISQCGTRGLPGMATCRRCAGLNACNLEVMHRAVPTVAYGGQITARIWSDEH